MPAGPTCGGVKGTAVTIIHLSLLGISQDVVSFLDPLESLFCPIIVRIHVGMVLARQLTIRSLYIRLRGVSFDPQNLVIIFFHGALLAALFSRPISRIGLSDRCTRSPVATPTF